MKRDTVARIELDAMGRLHIVPRSQEFPFIWREAMEVHWDAETGSLYSPPPRRWLYGPIKWSYGQWLLHVLSAARAQGYELEVSPDTKWVNVDPGARREMLERLVNSQAES